MEYISCFDPLKYSSEIPLPYKGAVSIKFIPLSYAKSNILNATLFIDEQINNNNNVMVHCYWGLMRSPTVIASYLMYKYKMDVESSIQFIKDKKNLSFHSLYNFKEILYYVKEELDKIIN